MNDISGIDKRKVNRKKLALKREGQARSIVNECVDISILSNSKTQQPDFNAMWSKVDENLKTHRLFRGYIAYVEAYNFSVRYCQDLIEDASIEIGFPKLIVISERPKTFRNQDWFIDSKISLTVYIEWMNRLEAKSSPDIHDVFLSLIFHSAVLSEHKLNQIINDISSKVLSLNTIYELPVINLEINNEKIASNTYIETNGEFSAIHQSKVFISPITARLINLYLKQVRQVDESRYSKNLAQSTVYDIYNTIDILEGVNKISSVMALKRFLLASIYVIEDFLQVSLPENMWYLLTDQEHTYAISTPNWQSIIHNICHEVSDDKAIKDGNPISFEINNKHQVKRTSLTTQIAKLFKKDGSLKPSKKQFTENLTAIHVKLVSNHAPLNEVAITGWLLSKTTICKVSSIQTYSNTITNRWLSVGDGMELESFDEEDFQYFYNELIELGKTEKAKNQIAIHIDEIHYYLVNEHGIDMITPLSSTVRPHHKTGYISETMFQAILSQVDDLVINRETIESIKLALILGHRCGLRIGEIVKIRLNDLALLSYLEVRNNKYGDNKTSSALRRISLEHLLTDLDGELLKQVYARRLASGGDTLLATQAGIAYHTNEISRIVSEVIKEATGLSHLTTHHLRHSFLTNFQLMSFLYDHDYNFHNHRCYEWLKSLIPYSSERAKNILVNIEGLLPYKKVFALAGLAGHASPSTTYSSYVHLTDIQIGLILWHTDLQLTKHHASFIGLPRRKKQLINNPLLLNEYLIKKSKLKPLPKPKSHQTLRKDQQVVKRRYGFNEVNIILKNYSIKEDYKEWLIKLNVDEKIFNKWLCNARQLKENELFRTTKGNSRLFAPYDTLGLAPSFDRFADDKKILTRMTEKYRKLYTDNRDDSSRLLLKEFVLYTLIHSEYNKNIIRFSSHQVLFDYLKILSQLVYKKDIRITIYNYDKVPLKDQHNWDIAIDTIDSYPNNIHHVNLNQPSYQNSIRAEVSLASQTELQRIEARENSSNPIDTWTVRTIQIFCHYVYIMMGERISLTIT